MKELEKITKCNDMALEINARITHTTLHPIATYGQETWTMKKADRKKNSWSTVLEEGFTDIMDNQKDQ